jgi:peptide/nickel transport system substrate-binding protein
MTRQGKSTSIRKSTIGRRGALGALLPSRPGFVAGITVLAMVAFGSAQGAISSGTAAAAGAPQRGGVLKVLGQSDIFNLDTVSAYYTVSNMLNRAYARQLFSYDSTGSFASQLTIKPDVATVLPTSANGGISNGGKTYTIHLRGNVMWDSTPARAVTAADFVRQFKMLCNPVSPSGASGYFTATIAGMTAYCNGFAKAPATVAGIKAYVNGHSLAGVASVNATTIVFKLLSPAADFLNILSQGFCSARPIEYMAYLPDGAQFRAHTLSDGPYQITNYTAGKSITLGRNPAWVKSSDPLRGAYVNQIQITEGLTPTSVQQQLQVGTGNMEWDVTPPTQDIPGLTAQKDPRLIIGPAGNNYVDLGTYLALNQYHGPMTNKLVREAVAYAVNKNAIVQVLGGPAIAATTSQVVLPGSVGYVKGLNPFPDKNGAGDPAKAKALLKQAGYPNGVAIKLLYSTTDPGPRVGQSLQSSLQLAGFKVTLVPATQSDFYGKYLTQPASAKSGLWDVAPPGWIPDWFGNNGRSTIVPLLTAPGLGSNDFGGYSSKTLEADVAQALKATTSTAVSAAWAKANEQAVKDVAIVPVNVQKWPLYHSSNLQGCSFFWYSLNCDLPNVWLSK